MFFTLFLIQFFLSFLCSLFVFVISWFCIQFLSFFLFSIQFLSFFCLEFSFCHLFVLYSVFVICLFRIHFCHFFVPYSVFIWLFLCLIHNYLRFRLFLSFLCSIISFCHSLLQYFLSLFICFSPVYLPLNFSCTFSGRHLRPPGNGHLYRHLWDHFLWPHADPSHRMGVRRETSLDR